MKHFTSVADAGNLQALLAEAQQIKADRYALTDLGKTAPSS